MSLIPRDLWESLFLALAAINTIEAIHRMFATGDPIGPTAFSLACLLFMRVHRIEVHLNERARKDTRP